MTAPEHPRTGEPAPTDAAASVGGARYLTIEELAAATTLSVSTIRRLVKQGVIVAHQPGGPRHRIVFPPDAIEQVAKSAKPPEAESVPSAPPSGCAGRPQRGPPPKWSRRS